ncbi:hypothetical protein HMI54_013367, partial [Coelomomyces lativittatus]
MYGQHPMLHTERIYSTWNSQARQNNGIPEWTNARLHHIEFLQIARKQGALQLETHRESRRIEHNFKVSEKDCDINVGNLVLIRQNILDTAFTRKLEPRWKGPFKCIKKIGNTYYLSRLSGEPLTNPVSGHRLKRYHPPSPILPRVQTISISHLNSPLPLTKDIVSTRQLFPLASHDSSKLKTMATNHMPRSPIRYKIQNPQHFSSIVFNQ